MNIRVSTLEDKEFVKALDKENMEPIINASGNKYYGYMFETFEPKRCFILEENNLPIGFAYFHTPRNKLDIWSIQIKKDSQGREYGQRLMKHIIDFAKFKKLKKVVLEAHKTNTKALNFYRKYGFKELGELRQNKILFELDLKK